MHRRTTMTTISSLLEHWVGFTDRPLGLCLTVIFIYTFGYPKYPYTPMP